MFDIHEELKKLPKRPGVYLMKNEDGTIIYVGKAVNLANRVRQYFQSSAGYSPKLRGLTSHISEFEYVVTDNEVEALILECNLIKKHNPKYTSVYSDDSHKNIKIRGFCAASIAWSRQKAYRIYNKRVER